MRQIGTIANAEHARRFAAYMAAEKMPTHIEEDAGRWTVWARNEDQLDAAKVALDQFVAAPEDPRFRDAEARAAQVLREEQQKALAIKKNVVQVRNQWTGGSRSPFKRAPLTCVVIGLCVFVYFLMETGGEGVSAAQQWLSFSEIKNSPEPGMVQFYRDGYTQIRQGQIWRLITPIFLHFSIWHIVFNMMMFYWLGSRIEHRYGAWRMALMMLVIAVLSNVAQYQIEGSRSFGGLSGVVYGLFGFTWMKTLFDPGSGLYIDQQTVFIALAWLAMGVAAAIPALSSTFSFMPKVANSAHFVGLVAGMAICGLTLLSRRRSG